MWVMGVACAPLACFAQGADTRYVNVNAPAGGNGTSWATAYSNLRTALTAASGNPGVTKLWVAKGTYFPGSSRFALRNNLAIYGGFAGGETQLAQRNVFLNPTILTGQGTVGIIDGGTTNATAVLDGFTVRDGFTTGVGAAVINGSSTYRRCRFIGNRAGVFGGAWWGSASSPTFLDCEFIDNQADIGGGALKMDQGTFNLVGCRLVSNAGGIAAIEGFGLVVRMANCVVVDNETGGVRVTSGNVDIVGSTFAGNASDAIVSVIEPTSGVHAVRNTIIRGNGPADSPGYSGFFTVDYSCTQLPAPGIGNINADPGFINPTAGDWRVRNDSPVVDAGNSAALPQDLLDIDSDGNTTEQLPLDAAGTTRRRDEASVPDTGVGPAPVVDIGAFEAIRDCNLNGLEDSVEVANGTATDANGNGVPDDCEDCNDNNVVDEFDVANGTSEDCQKDGIPDECQLGTGAPVQFLVDDGTFDSMIGSYQAGNFIWLNAFQVMPGAQVLREVKVAFGSGISAGSAALVHVWADPTNDGNPADAVRKRTITVTAASPGTNVFTTVDIPDLIVGPVGTWFFVGMQVPAVQAAAPIDQDGTSRRRSWVASVSGGMDANPDNLGASGEFGLIDSYGLAGNWLIRAVGSVEGDCNDNGIPDACDIAGGTSADCNGNLIPDSCELATADCNGNGIPDDCDIASGAAGDCQGNGIPDSCEIAQGVVADVDSNGVPDGCEDCNSNDVPDGIDIEKGTSADCQPDGIPDECQLPSEELLVYAYDDADPEFWVSSDAPNMAWLNNFTIEEGKERIIALDIMFGIVPVGKPHKVCLWSDPNGDGNPDDAQVLASIDVAASDVGQASVYTRVDIADIDLAPGTSFFVGAILNGFALGNDVPGPKDSNPPNGKSWLIGSDTAVDANDLSRNADEFIRIDDLAGAFIGNWCIRAAGVSIADCNGNNIPDDCDIADGTSSDANKDGIPDECAPCTADLDLDGEVGPTDLSIVLSGWGTATPLADLDDDGDVDAADLLVLLNARGSCK